jgi:hypothetical protein
MRHVDLARLMDRSAADAASYTSAKPFPHIVIDGLFQPATAAGLSHDFPAVDDATWSRHIHENSHKYALGEIDRMPTLFREVITELNSAAFVDYLTALTAIDGLLPDDLLVGAGLHQIMRGGFLEVHADFNFHPVTEAHRRLNLIVYLNPDWQEDWHGDLELWDADMSRCVRSIAPVHNRVVVFAASDTAYHGHPEPLACPGSRSRRSIAMYYYTNSRPEHEVSSPHSTLYQRR